MGRSARFWRGRMPVSFFSGGHAQIDGLNLPKAITAGVGSQSNTTYYATVNIDLGDGLAFDAYAGFTQGMEALGMGLLGQSGFFDSFTVEFRHAQKLFIVATL